MLIKYIILIKEFYDPTYFVMNIFLYFSGGIPIRFIFAALAAVSFAIIYGLKVNLSIAIVRMVCHNVKDNGEVKNLSTSDFNVSRPETDNTTCDTVCFYNVICCTMN